MRHTGCIWTGPAHVKSIVQSLGYVHIKLHLASGKGWDHTGLASVIWITCRPLFTLTRAAGKGHLTSAVPLMIANAWTCPTSNSLASWSRTRTPRSRIGPPRKRALYVNGELADFPDLNRLSTDSVWDADTGRWERKQ
jgi:hypothetical protein